MNDSKHDNGVLPKNIPSSLRSCPQWVVWRAEERNGSVTKLPYQISGKPAKSNSPSTWGEFDTVWAVYQRGRFDGVGFVFSADDDFCGIDLDGCRNPETGEFATWAQDVIDQFDTYCEVSPSGSGVKLFLRGKSPLSSGKNQKLTDVEPLGGKSPGVEVYDRKRYFAVTGWEVETVSPNVECRQPELNDFCEQYWPRTKRPAASRRSANTGGQSLVVGRARKYVARMPAAIAGQGGHDVAFRTACVLVQGFELSPDEAYPIYADWNQTCEPPWSDREMRHKLDSAEQQPGDRGYLKNVPATTGGAVIKVGNQNSSSVLQPEQQTDLSNARRFVKAHGDKVRFCHPWGQWLVWDGARWKREHDGAPIRLAKSIADNIWKTARDANDARLLRFAAMTASLRSINAMLELSQSDLPLVPDDMDGDGWLLNCLNGTVDLRTGELREHRREDSLTLLCPTRFDPAAKSPRWDKFLQDIFAGDVELIQFVQRFFGYSLTSDVREQVLPIFWGVGANGKSTLLNAFLQVLGSEYSMQAPPDLLMVKRADSHPTERADLFRKRFVSAVETENGCRLAESLIKQLTGGERIRARRMRQDFWEFDPSHKMVLCTNHKPRVRGTDHAIWRRIRLVPFTQKFEAARQDKTLPEKLAAECSGILSWAIRGCQDWQSEGLTEPEIVKVATAEYRSSQDAIAAFIGDCCTLGGELWTRTSELRGVYEDWCKERGDKPVGGNAFADGLERQCCTRDRKHAGRGWSGIGLLTERDTVSA